MAEWEWDFGDTTGSVVPSPVHNYTSNGTYSVTLIVTSQYGCKDTVVRPIEVRDFSFYIPNAFSPNGDDVNELFFGKGHGIIAYEMSIFDRWGNLIFHCSIEDLPQTLPCMWDGKVQGGRSNEKVQEDVYVYQVKLTTVFYTQLVYVGNVSVVR